MSSSSADAVAFFGHELKGISALACLVASFSEFATLTLWTQAPCLSGGHRKTAAGEIALSDVISSEDL